jgi:Adenine-specific methyltransferase EcoRI
VGFVANENLSNARAAKNDEFYTQFGDIEKEMNAYLDFDPDAFRGKTVLLPCDDPEWSNFTRYFAQNFEKLGLKKLISTSYAPDSRAINMMSQPTLFESLSPQFDAIKTTANGKIFTLDHDTNGNGNVNLDDLEWGYLEGDGDFRSDEVTALRDEADIIITNPPFSLFRQFLRWIIEANKQFVIIGNMNAITYKESFPLIQSNRMWIGATNFNVGMYFFVPEGFTYAPTYKFERELEGVPVNRVPGVCWFTNIDHGRRHEPLLLMTEADNKKFSKHKEVKGVGYRKYDNYDAIEVPFTDAIPSDYKGLMGVPISFLSKYNPDQFEIMGSQRWAKSSELMRAYCGEKTAETDKSALVNGKEKYDRIFIRHR